jgi:cytochrome c-type biogenesis protein CcmH
VAWIGLMVAAAALLAVAVVDQGGAETEVERVQRLQQTFACPECSGESVSDSNAAVSATIRQYINQRVAEGATDQELRDELVRAYGVEVLLNPPAEGFAALVWVLPVLVASFGAMGAAIALTRRRPAPRAPTDDDRSWVVKARARTQTGDGAGDRATSADAGTDDGELPS